jgi:hypothetical protein
LHLLQPTMIHSIFHLLRANNDLLHFPSIVTNNDSLPFPYIASNNDSLHFPSTTTSK